MLNQKIILLKNIIKRDIESKFKGSLLGSLWVVVTPLMLLLVYFYVFSVVFRARWSLPQTGEIAGSALSALILFSGLTCFNFFSECFGRAPGLMRENTSFIKKIVFPLHLLPLGAIGLALFNLVISYGLLFFLYFLIVGIPPITVLLLPLVLLPFILFTSGLTFFLASLGVYLPDIKQIVPPISMAVMFLSPIFYPMDMVPASLKDFVMLNPFTWFLEDIRNVLFNGIIPPFESFGVELLSTGLFFILSILFFQKTKKGFSDVL